MTRLPDPSVRPAGLADQFGRVARDLRVSVTDRCNLRCTYCMPAEGLPWMPKPEMLTDEELLRIIGLFVRDGVTQVRLTGGEPLLRRSPRRPRRRHRGPRAASEDRDDDQRRRPRAGRARSPTAGLDRVNVSLDTIDSETSRS